MRVVLINIRHDGFTQSPSFAVVLKLSSIRTKSKTAILIYILTDTLTYTHTHTLSLSYINTQCLPPPVKHLSSSTRVYASTPLCMCAFVCVRETERDREGEGVVRGV